MTVYARHSRGFEEGVEVFEYDELPYDLRNVWEVETGTWWQREGRCWSAPEVPGCMPAKYDDEELLAEWGPVTDDRAEALVLTGGES